MKNLTQAQKSMIVSQFPELRDWIEQRETNSILQGLFASISMMKGDKGDKGDPGKDGKDGITPKKGVDYWTNADVKMLIGYLLPLVTPVKGKHYFTETEIRDVIKASTPRKGVHYVDGEKGDKGDKGETGRLLSPFEIAAIFNQYEGLLDGKVIKDMPTMSDILSRVSKELKDPKSKYRLRKGDLGMPESNPLDMRWHGSGSSSSSNTTTSGGGGMLKIDISGTIDDSNMSFTATAVPKFLCINGLVYAQNGGAITWTYLAGAITTSVPVGKNGSIFGIAGTVINVLISGTVDDSNTSFTSSVEPELVVINGASYPKTGGPITWTWSAGVVTTSVPVGTGGSIFGIAGVSSELVASGTVNDSNKTFTTTSQPTFMLINGSLYQQTGGNITWSYSSGTEQLSSPVGTGGFLLGII